MTENQESTGGVRRRVFVAGAAWTAPVVVASTTTPAFAASPGICRTYNLAVSTYLRTSTGTQTALRTGTVSATTAAPTASLSIGVRSQSFGNNELSSQAGYSDQTISNVETVSGGPNLPALCFANLKNTQGNANREEITLSFGVAIRRLAFTITNVDKNAGHSDAIAVFPVGFTATFPNATKGATGAGTVANPFRVTVDGGSNGGYSDGVRVVYGETVIPAATTLKIHYWNDNTTANTIAAIYLSQMSFDVCSGDA